ncbi:MAG: two-component system sensor histidine kinase NtrB, partial [Candidatus Kapaibacterium sp.]
MPTRTSSGRASRRPCAEHPTPATPSEAEHRHDFLSAAAVAFLCVEPETWTVIEANAAAAALFRCDPADIAAMRLPVFESAYRTLSRRKAPAEVVVPMEIPLVDGSALQVEAHAWMHGSPGEHRSVAALLRDAGNEQSARRQSVQRDTMILLGKLTTMVAHEIRNPLSVVNLHLQLLQRTVHEDEKSLRSVRTAMQGVERMTNIVSSTLDFAKPLIPKTEPCDVHGIITDTLEILRETLFQKITTITFDLEDHLPRIDADVTQLGHVFLHVIRNAFDALGNRGTIHIATMVSRTRSNRELHIRITDNGCGIVHGDLACIFDPFFSRKAEGLGLGLTTARRIIEHHKGRIDVQSIRGTG